MYIRDRRAEVHREGKVFVQEFSKGDPLADVKVTGKSDLTGTIITFRPDKTIFQVSEYNFEILEARLRELAYLNKGIKISLEDKREMEETENGPKPRSIHFKSDEGLKEFVQYLDGNREKLTEPVCVEIEKQGIPVEIALEYNNSYNENVFSYVNNINTIEGGTHVAGFRRALTLSLIHILLQ